MMYMMESRRCSVSAINLMNLISILGIDVEKLVRVISLTNSEMDEENTTPEAQEGASEEAQTPGEGQGEAQGESQPTAPGNDKEEGDVQPSDSETPKGSEEADGESQE